MLKPRKPVPALAFDTVGGGRRSLAAPPLFAEPGRFLVKPDRTLYWSNVSTMPFARPHFNPPAAKPRSPS